MGKKILTFGDNEIEKNKLYPSKSPMQILSMRCKYLYRTRFILMKKTMNTLLVPCIMIINLPITYNKLPKTSAAVIDKLNGCIFRLKMMTY